MLHHRSVQASSKWNKRNLTLTLTLNPNYTFSFFHNKICVFIIIFTALSFLRLIHELFIIWGGNVNTSKWVDWSKPKWEFQSKWNLSYGFDFILPVMRTYSKKENFKGWPRKNHVELFNHSGTLIFSLGIPTMGKKTFLEFLRMKLLSSLFCLEFAKI